ncbi:MAG: PLP-dependent transferase [Candidatus Methanomethylophilaceae archaeon]|nr:PLP-dependent transferase [Candidatus Methanomethylophilaceae archaeon]MBR4203738.1 PLP-dependent transferase [Candidatus Methanomethylophilaceae archaeon]
MNNERTGERYSLNTALIHGGDQIDEQTGAVSVPIYQTSTFKQDGLGKNRGFEYSRTGNPTRKVLEDLIADLEGGVAGFAFASGMAAITTVLSLFKSGDKILISRNVYGGTFRVLDKVFKNFGIVYTILDSEDPGDLRAKITDDVKALLLESPANPLMAVTDIRAFSEVAHEKGVTVIVDNTFMTPYLQRPLELGADIVVHSGTKYLGGHSDLVAGLAVVKDKETAERLAFLQNATGGVLQPFDSFLLIRGIKTLSVRLDRHVENAHRIAKYLESNPDVSRVYYPGLETDPGYKINSKQARNGGAMLSFELKEGHDLNRFFGSLELISLAESLGGVESLVCHPSTMTHASIPEDIRKAVGITDGLIRLSPGIEDVDDIIRDLDRAIKESRR